MADNSYSIEQRLASKNGYHSPAEAKAFYGRYAREGITWHWWGDGTGASNHDNIVNYILNKATKGTGSVNYVLSDNKITLLVGPDNVAWCSQAGNPTTISVELQPTLGAEGYKKAGWLMDQLEQRYGRRLNYYGHNKWFATACPGTINMARIRTEADKWKSGGYDAPVVTPTPPQPIPIPEPPVKLIVRDVPNRKVMLNKDATLWDLQFNDWSEAKAVKTLNMGEVNANGGFEVSAWVQHQLGGRYYITEYSYAKGIQNGINVKDTDVPDPTTLNAPITPPIIVPGPLPPIINDPLPPVIPEPAPEPTPEPEPPVEPVPPEEPDKDAEQDERLSKIEEFINKLKGLLG